MAIYKGNFGEDLFAPEVPGAHLDYDLPDMGLEDVAEDDFNLFDYDRTDNRATDRFIRGWYISSRCDEPRRVGSIASGSGEIQDIPVLDAGIWASCPNYLLNTLPCSYSKPLAGTFSRSPLYQNNSFHIHGNQR